MRAERYRYGAPGWGGGELWLDGEIVLAHEFSFGGPDSGSDPEGSTGLLARRVRAFLGGADDSFSDVHLDLSWCSPFERAVAETLRSVPRGEVVTYGELAALAGHVGAQRAVGSFCARNRFAFFVPCHRVVAADGIGSYGSAGIPVKERLLALEGAAA